MWNLHVMFVNHRLLTIGIVAGSHSGRSWHNGQQFLAFNPDTRLPLLAWPYRSIKALRGVGINAFSPSSIVLCAPCQRRAFLAFLFPHLCVQLDSIHQRYVLLASVSTSLSHLIDILTIVVVGFAIYTQSKCLMGFGTVSEWRFVDTDVDMGWTWYVVWSWARQRY